MLWWKPRKAAEKDKNKLRYPDNPRRSSAAPLHNIFGLELVGGQEFLL